MNIKAYRASHDLEIDRESLGASLARHLEYTLGKDEFSATPRDVFTSLAYAVRDRMFGRWKKTQQGYHTRDVRRVYYLSLEYLLGRVLSNSLLNLGIQEDARQALTDLGIEFADLEAIEFDPGLGNGGLGRLAACFMDSMATLGIPAVGYGIRYEYGIFRQDIVDGRQVEHPDNWLRYGTPWQIPRPEQLFVIQFGGRVQTCTEASGQLRFAWVDTDNIIAIPSDMPVPGYRNGVANTLRLWSAHASRELNISSFNRGDYIAAVEEKNASENLARVLYPNDASAQGSELRLKQEYFFVSATLQDAIRRHLNGHDAVDTLADKAVFQLNDTHPSIAVAELMRLFVDEHAMDWDHAWSITTRCFAYTNHTVLPEALETWPVGLLERVLPRHLQIIYEINRRWLEDVRARFPGDADRVRRLSLIDEGTPRRVRMAHLAIVGSFAVNGVSALHSRLLAERLFADFAEYSPEKFGNQTNGISPRRWLACCNPTLSSLITSSIGDGWQRDLNRLTELRALADEPAFCARWQDARQANKQRLARHLQSRLGIDVDEQSLFDVHVKRFHEYKRQLLNLLHVIALYQRIKSGDADRISRTILFAGKSAPGYDIAKLTIRLIHDVASVINNDPDTRDRLQLLFVPNYSVSEAEVIIPGADLSEQISTAGWEASGTGNMKFALNGAITIGTLDGANIEIRDVVGADNIFIFGLTEAELSSARLRGYDPMAICASNPLLSSILDWIAGGYFSSDDAARYRPITDGLLHGDPYFVLADFHAYCQAQQHAEAAFRDTARWTRMSILNVASMGRFSSDATIAGYARDIWRVPSTSQTR